MLLIPVTALCVNKKTIKPFVPSRWKEVKRMKTDSTVVPFSDTMFISFFRKDTFSYHYKDGFIYNGRYTLTEDSLLDFGTIRFKVAVKKQASLMLVNDMGIYVFTLDSSDTAKAIVIAKDEKPLPVTDVDQMIGHWTVYKKTVDGVGTLDVGTQVRSAFITGPSSDGKLGYIFGGNDPNNGPSWYIKGYSPSDQFLDCDGKSQRKFKVIKCQKGELIIDEDGMRYYFKQFK